MLRNFKIYSNKVVMNNFVIAKYKVSLVKVSEKTYKKPHSIALRINSNIAKIHLLKNQLDLDKDIEGFKIIHKYDEFFPYVKIKKPESLEIDIIRKHNSLIETPDSLISRNRRQELIKMNFDDKKVKTNRNILLISSSRKYEFLNNYTSF